MVIDTSALLAILLAEADGERYEAAIENDPIRMVSGVSVVEASIVLERRFGAVGGRELDLLLHRATTEVVAVSPEQVEWARYASRVYGKGVHPAALNFGDCFPYALAKVSGEPLLFKGYDFSQTDIQSALS